MASKKNMKNCALWYANMGFAVIPIPKGGKGPVLNNWKEKATSDLNQVSEWWDRWPDSNIGMVTGPKSKGVFCIDIDVDDKTGEDGRETLRKWEIENGPLPETWQDISGRGGSHLFFQSDQTIPNDKKKIHPGIEIRGHDLNVVLVPSIHPSGKQYEWECGHAPNEIGLHKANDQVLKFCLGSKSGQKTDQRFHVPPVLNQGEREYVLFQSACSLQAQGWPDNTILIAIKALNEEICAEPLPEREISQLVSSALKYNKGDIFDKWKQQAKWQELEILEMLRGSKL